MPLERNKERLENVVALTDFMLPGPVIDCLPFERMAGNELLTLSTYLILSLCPYIYQKSPKGSHH